MKTSGKVVKGKGEGTKIGFPTANIEVTDSFKSGIYAGYARLAEDASPNLQALFYIPESDSKVIECHILDFPARDLYGNYVTVEIIQRLRDKQDFSGLEEAYKQIKKDEQEAREWFKNRES